MKRGFLGNQIFDRLLDDLSNATGFEILRWKLYVLWTFEKSEMLFTPRYDHG